MKTGKITINGTEHTLAFTVRAAAACEERFGGLKNLSDALTNGDRAISNIVWMLATMIDCGRRYMIANGEDAPDAPSEDDLLDTMSLDEIRASVTSIMTTVAGGKETKVNAVPPKSAKKNVKATPRT